MGDERVRLPEELTWPLAGRGAHLEPGAARVVNGTLETVSGAARVAIVAHFDADSRFSPSTLALVRELAGAGFACAVVTTSPAVPDPADALGATVVIHRPNRGHDFGSWATALRMVPSVRSAEVVLTNDSMVGPFAPLAGLLSTAANSGADVWAVTSSLQVSPHLQSYFLRFSPGVLAHPALVEFFAGVRHLTNKVAIVRRYELGLTRTIQRAGLRNAVGFPSSSLAAGRMNPTLVAWRELMEAGYPFFKRTLLRDPRVRVETTVLRAAVRDIFGADLDDFLGDSR